MPINTMASKVDPDMMAHNTDENFGITECVNVCIGICASL